MKKLFVLIFSSCLCLAILETVSPYIYRHYFNQEYDKIAIRNKYSMASSAIKLPERNEYFRVSHPYLGFTENPRLNGVVLNKYGFYGPDPVELAESDKYIVAISGGSVAFNLFFDNGETLIRELSKIPQLADKEIALVSLAISGYKQPQQLLALMYFLAQGARFDLVLNLDGFNEIAVAARNYRNGSAPVFPMDWHTVADNQLKEKDNALYQMYFQQESQRRSFKAIFSRFPFSVSNTFLVFRELRSRRLEAGKELARQITTSQELITENKSGDSGQEDQYNEFIGPRVNFNERELLNDSADIWEESSRQLNRITRANQILYFHFLQPNQYVPFSKKMLPDERQKSIQEEPNYFQIDLVKKGYQLLAQRGDRLRTQGINFIDLRFIFKDILEELYTDTCCHLNKRGSRIIVKEMAEAVKAYLNRVKFE